MVREKASKVTAPCNDYGFYAKGFYAGFRAYSKSPKLKRSYLQVQLTEKLENNQMYCVSFDLSLADLSRYAVPDIGAIFSDRKIERGGTAPNRAEAGRAAQEQQNHGVHGRLGNGVRHLHRFRRGGVPHHRLLRRRREHRRGKGGKLHRPPRLLHKARPSSPKPTTTSRTSRWKPSGVEPMQVRGGRRARHGFGLRQLQQLARRRLCQAAHRGRGHLLRLPQAHAHRCRQEHHRQNRQA